MELKIALYIFALIISSNSSILISPDQTAYPGTNCSGHLDYFLCNCLNANATINIQLVPGYYNFTNQQFCLLKNKAAIIITGSTINDTIIQCVEPFSIVFMNVHNVTISNIKMINCGDVMNEVANVMINESIPIFYFGNGFKFAMMFYEATNVSIIEFAMLNTLGYGIVAFNMMGEVSLFKLHIENTTFENTKCVNDTNDNSLNCLRSGVLFAYFNTSSMMYNTTLNITQSIFKNNRNLLPADTFKIFSDLIQTGSYYVPVPIEGAGCIAVFYLQSSFDVNTVIADSLFQSNTGTLSAAIAIVSVSTNRGRSNIKNCSFLMNNVTGRFPYEKDLQSRGGTSYYYLVLRNSPEIPVPTSNALVVAELFNITQCEFIGSFGETIHIETIFSIFVSVVVRIERCIFSQNKANTGSGVVAVNHKFDDSSIAGGLTVHLVNVNADNNDILPNATLQHSSTAIITGVFSSNNAWFVVNCSANCSFVNNRPSVFYGDFSSLTLSGSAVFCNNSARYGGALRLLSTVALIYENSELYFYQNHAVMFGGAIDIYFSTTEVRTHDVCPIQFIGSGSAKLITNLNEIDQLNVNITFKSNTVGTSNSLQSIYSDTFYECTWYPNSIVQIRDLGIDSPVVNGTRQSVYKEVFQFIPKENTSDHLFIAAYLPCPCNKNNHYDPHSCLTASENDSLKLESKVTLGQSFQIYLMSLDVVGSIGSTDLLYSEVTEVSDTSSEGISMLVLADHQFKREFSVTGKSCVPVEFTIFNRVSKIPKHGILHLSVSHGYLQNINFDFANCSIGFNLQLDNKMFACVCGSFFVKPDIKNDFHCDFVSGNIIRIDQQSWLSVVDDKVEYSRLCSPEYCNTVITTYILMDSDILCDNNHRGRACGGCIDDYGRVFGSNSCRRCSNAWLVTILLYAILGIILVVILYLLKLTVTMGTINGLIFFCNVISINERLFFNTEDSQFIFLRVAFSIINLDLGFEMCFYHEMSEIVKTGLQFVFPVYLWFLVTVIIILGKFYYQQQQSTSRATSVPVLATLIYLSYSKLLRTAVSVFTSVTIQYTSKESNNSGSQQLTAWQPDPNVEYLHDGHIVLFLIALVFMLLFIIPFALAMTFPTIVLRSKRASRLFPLLDCFYAPYKDKYRYWFGARIIVLVYLSVMESVLFSYQESLLLSSTMVILAFTIVQAYIHPFKQKTINILDLLFMTIFIVLSTITLYLFTTSDHECINIAVQVLGSIAFSIICFVVALHINDVIKHTRWYKYTIAKHLWWYTKVKSKLIHIKNQEPLVKNVNLATDDIKEISYCHYQESLFDHI